MKEGGKKGKRRKEGRKEKERREGRKGKKEVTLRPIFTKNFRAFLHFQICISKSA
jgi:hypothetical protein